MPLMSPNLAASLVRRDLARSPRPPINPHAGPVQHCPDHGMPYDPLYYEGWGTHVRQFGYFTDGLLDHVSQRQEQGCGIYPIGPDQTPCPDPASHRWRHCWNFGLDVIPNRCLMSANGSWVRELTDRPYTPFPDIPLSSCTYVHGNSRFHHESPLSRLDFSTVIPGTPEARQPFLETTWGRILAGFETAFFAAIAAKAKAAPGDTLLVPESRPRGPAVHFGAPVPQTVEGGAHGFYFFPQLTLVSHVSRTRAAYQLRRFYLAKGMAETYTEAHITRWVFEPHPVSVADHQARRVAQGLPPCPSADDATPLPVLPPLIIYNDTGMTATPFPFRG